MAGAIGDMFWHIVFGIEVSIDALLSPTHLLLLIGALLILSGPLRAAWFDDDPPPGLRPLLPAVLAATMAAAQLGFFFQYMDGTSIRFMETPYIPGVETGYFAVVAGVGSVLITTDDPDGRPAPADAEMDIALRRRAGPVRWFRAADGVARGLRLPQGS